MRRAINDAWHVQAMTMNCNAFRERVVIFKIKSAVSAGSDSWSEVVSVKAQGRGVDAWHKRPYAGFDLQLQSLTLAAIQKRGDG